VAAGLQLVALVLAHELVFLARYGSLYGEALVHSGHGETWHAAVTTSFALGLALAAAATLRLVRLGILARRTRAVAGPGAGSLLQGWLRIAPRIALLAVVLLTLQENVERGALAGGAFDPWLLLSAQYAGGIWIAIAVGLGVGFVAALHAWRERVLLAWLRATRPAVPRRGASSRRAVDIIDRPDTSLLGRRSALRAPPLVAAT
jgi:hypothetical protein